MENISFRILRICIFLYATELQNGQLSTVAEPCPDIAQSTTIADMCTTDFASEETHNAGTTADSVALRVVTQQDGCTCEVSLHNQKSRYTLKMRKYDGVITAAPEQDACGLAIDIDYIIPNNLPESKVPIKCTNGTDVRTITLAYKGVLTLRSRIIGGTFTRGYCMQIFRSQASPDNPTVQINCSSSNTTHQMTGLNIKDQTASDTDSTLHIAIGVCSAGVLLALFVVLVILHIRRKGNENKDENEVQPDNECADYDSDGLKYNTLYNSSEQQDIMEGDYHTVDLEGRKKRTGIHTFDVNYSAIDGNYSSDDIVHMPAKDGSKSDSKIKSTFNTTHRSEIQQTEEEKSNNLKHVTPMAGSNVEYAVVDKRGTTDQNVKHISAPNDSNVEYAVINKK